MLYRFKNELGAFVFWSNSCGDLHRNGDYDIKDMSELSSNLQYAYKNLWRETYPVYCYLAEFNTQEGIALELSYDRCYASDYGISYAELLEIAHDKAVQLSRKYPDYDVIMGEDAITWSDESKDTVVYIILPWDTDPKKVEEIADFMDEIGYKIPEEKKDKYSKNQALFEDYKKSIKTFMDDTILLDAALEESTMTDEEKQLYEIIAQCRGKLVEVHNKINDPIWVMPTPFKED